MALVKCLLNKFKYNSFQSLLINKCRYIHTSRTHHDDDVSFVKKHNDLSEIKKKEIEEDVKEKTKNWISYGFSVTDKDDDTYNFVATNVLIVSFFGCTMAFLLIFFPKQREKDWAMREAYLELDRREKLGLQLIDPNFIPLDRISLPSEEELGQFKLTI